MSKPFGKCGYGGAGTIDVLGDWRDWPRVCPGNLIPRNADIAGDISRDAWDGGTLVVKETIKSTPINDTRRGRGDIRDGHLLSFIEMHKRSGTARSDGMGSRNHEYDKKNIAGKAICRR